MLKTIMYDMILTDMKYPQPMISLPETASRHLKGIKNIDEKANSEKKRCNATENIQLQFLKSVVALYRLSLIIRDSVFQIQEL